MTEEIPLWLIRHTEKELSTRFINARKVGRGAFRRSWLVNTSNGAVAVTRVAGGEPTMEILELPERHGDITCTVCDWHMRFVGTDFPIRAYCTNCGTLHELWHDGRLSRVGEPQATMPSEVVADAPPVKKAPRKTAAKKAPAKKAAVKKAVAAPKKAPAKKTPAKKPVKKPATKPAYVDYKGDIDRVIDIEGIGPVYADRLVGAGIKTTARFSYETAAKIAKVTKAPLKTVNTWKANAELMKINGVGPQYAEAMARAGISGIEELKHGNAEAIAGQLNKYLDSLDVNVIGTKITPKRVAGWQKKAAPMRKLRQKVPVE